MSLRELAVFGGTMVHVSSVSIWSKRLGLQLDYHDKYYDRYTGNIHKGDTTSTTTAI